MGREAGLLTTAREQIRTRHMSYRTEKTYLHWMHRFILFHERRHPRDLGPAAVEQFLSYLAVERKVGYRGGTGPDD
ncbi:MAG: phage integrase N-terminal SAM-like domain-containing protein [Gammaproteobacteria bacterium]|nr:phage integrase N-terminal SAM-like domain-containing protein [Gammaproteobacteria bacterium]